MLAVWIDTKLSDYSICYSLAILLGCNSVSVMLTRRHPEVFLLCPELSDQQREGMFDCSR